MESYPRKGELSDAHSYHGPVSLYSSEGFFVVNETENSMVMRRRLTKDIWNVFSNKKSFNLSLIFSYQKKYNTINKDLKSWHTILSN